LNIDAAQIFLKTPNRWKSSPLKKDDVSSFIEKKMKLTNLEIFAHNGYLINLCSEGETFKKSLDAMLEEINRADALGIEHIVIHPGNHLGKGESFAVRKIAESLDMIFLEKENSTVKILLETTAGQGTAFGYRFEHLRDIIAYSKYQERLDVCLDTCHIFAAGYRISDEDGYNSVIEEFDKILGLDRLKLIHLNDSKREYGSRVDRHEHIGEGMIGINTFKLLLNDKRIYNVPLVLETPKSDENHADIMNLNMVQSLINK
ncbi:MAG: deoxyribonuclease IV, partial [Spirochaetota bacterium]|nr:deoxyribonuclease IV [Spirochaetota bacterium]